MARIHENNWIWVICCCGFLPFIGLVKGLIAVIPCMLIQVISCTFIALILLPHDIFYSFYSILKTCKIGRNTKTLAILLLPIPLLLWPEFVLIVFLIISVGEGLFSPITKTFDERYNLFYGGIIETISKSLKNVKDFWNFNYNSYFSYLADFRNEKLSTDKKPFDISIIELFIGLIIGTSGAIIEGILFTLLNILKLIPAIVRGYIELWKCYCKLVRDCGESCLDFVWFGLYFFSFILGNILIPPCVVLVSAFLCITGFFIGISSGYIAYKEGIPAACLKILSWAKEFDRKTNEIIYN